MDGFLSHVRRIWKNHTEWKVKFNVRYLIGQAGVVPIIVQNTGGFAVVLFVLEKRWYLTNTLSF